MTWPPPTENLEWLERDPGPHGRLWRWLAGLSWFFSIASFVVGSGLSFPTIFVSSILSAAWVLVFIAGFFIVGWCGLWLLFGLPFAALWPVVYVLIFVFHAELTP
jgi:hypothetical protein